MTKEKLNVESVTAKAFYLTDEDGKVRCELSSTKSRGETVIMFRMTDNDGDPLVSIEASSSRSVVSVSSPSDENAVRLMSDTNGNAVVVCNSKGWPRINIGKDKITFFDDSANPIRTLNSKGE